MTSLFARADSLTRATRFARSPGGTCLTRRRAGDSPSLSLSCLTRATSLARVLQTNFGDLHIALYDNAAPKTTSNVAKLLDLGLYVLDFVGFLCSSPLASSRSGEAPPALCAVRGELYAHPTLGPLHVLTPSPGTTRTISSGSTRGLSPKWPGSRATCSTR